MFHALIKWFAGTGLVIFGNRLMHTVHIAFDCVKVLIELVCLQYHECVLPIIHIPLALSNVCIKFSVSLN
jgi:hypothetical protein